VAERLARRFWPGLLTLVLPARPGLPATWLGADGTLALRVSGHPVAGALVAALGGPLVATSANVSGQPPAARVADVDPAVRAAADLVLPDGPAPGGGVGSTLVRVTVHGGWEVLREGAIPRAAVAAALGAPAPEPPRDEGEPRR
jgi:L-threonylcarbamoyladenylate synthase